MHVVCPRTHPCARHLCACSEQCIRSPQIHHGLMSLAFSTKPVRLIKMRSMKLPTDVAIVSSRVTAATSCGRGLRGTVAVLLMQAGTERDDSRHRL